MSLDIDGLTRALVKAFTETNIVTSYDASTGNATEETKEFKPAEDKMRKLASEVINHIKDNAEVYQVKTDVSTTVNTTVAPGIPIVSPAGPGSTTAPGTGAGSGTGFGNQNGTGKVK